jgi:hypothetical protein
MRLERSGTAEPGMDRATGLSGAVGATSGPRNRELPEQGCGLGEVYGCLGNPLQLRRVGASVGPSFQVPPDFDGSGQCGVLGRFQSVHALEQSVGIQPHLSVKWKKFGQTHTTLAATCLHNSRRVAGYERQKPRMDFNGASPVP